ncbi:putative ABC transport system permease protein [Paenibacillus sp. W4I10]|uniref:ABC transporter permease n=1 Tax=Paenibacillus TaxID=44249 RepID=UPI00277D7335|nr:ABC transporter permease [Paenibacillus sp. W4I10]MDQ0722443.1 putative ABC transport system permease protein [Paenibacillus sp. W4I10]
MRQILKAIFVSKKIFTIIFIGFLLTTLPILIALSTQSYYEEHFYHSKNGHFKNYYSVTLTNFQNVDLLEIQELAETNFKDASVITGDITVTEPEIGQIQIIGLLNPENWSPPLIRGSNIVSNVNNEIIVGRLISDHIGTIKVLDHQYMIKGIAGKDLGDDLINVYNFKMYVYMNELPDSIKQNIIKQNALQLIVRSNQNPETEINRFISELSQQHSGLQAKIVDEHENYKKEKNARQGVNEVLSYPYKLFLIALINCINVSYLWIYSKRKEISLRKALGASNFNLFVHIVSQLTICAVLAGTCSILIQWFLSILSLKILNVTSYYISVSFSHFIFGILITLVISVITAIIPFFHMLKIEPAKALKE